MTDADVNRALSKSCLGDFNAKSMTNSLSVGQIQLLSLAQAFLGAPSKVVLLDEPTSQIDGATQNKVLKNLFTHFKQSTVLMIAHRLETAVSFTDKILVLEKGKRCL